MRNKLDFLLTIFIAALAFLVPASSASAQALPRSLLDRNDAVEGIDPSCEHALYLLRHGRSYEIAIRILRDGVQSDPHSPAYHRALACALIDRAASIAHAASKIDTYRDYHERYVRDCERWRAAQDGNPSLLDTADLTNDAVAQELDTQPGTSPLKNLTEDKRQNAMTQVVAMIKKAEARYNRRFALGSPPPVEPILRTPDDQRPFKLTYEQARSVFDALSRESMDEFGKSLALATDANEAALTDNAKAWAALLISKDCALLREESPFDRSVLLDMFQKAVDLRGDSCDYIRSKADAAAETTKTRSKPADPEIVEAIGLYRKALAHERRDDAHVNARIFFLLQTWPPGALKSDAEATIALNCAIKADPGNAFLLYLQSSMLLDKARSVAKYSPLDTPEGGSALAAIEQGNHLPRFDTAIYSEAMPADLAFAWSYENRILSPGLMLISMTHLSEELCTAAATQLKTGDRDETQRIYSAIVGMGRQVQSQLPVDPMTWTPAEHFFDFITSHILEQGYYGLSDYYKAVNDKPNALVAVANWHRVADAQQDRNDAYDEESMFGYRDE